MTLKLSNSLSQQYFDLPKMSLYYDLTNDIDLMNCLMEKHGHSLGMAKFRDCKIASGFEEVISYEGAQRITRWVKNKKKAKRLSLEKISSAAAKYVVVLWTPEDAKPIAKDAKDAAKPSLHWGECWGATLTRDEAWAAGLGGAGGDLVFTSSPGSTY